MTKKIEKNGNKMTNNVVLVEIFKTTGNKKIVAIFPRYRELQKWMEDNRDKLVNHYFEIWREQTIKNKFLL